MVDSLNSRLTNATTSASLRTNVIFDFDQTIFPAESTLCLAQKIAKGNKALENHLLYRELRKKTITGKVVDLKNLLSLLPKINKEIVNEFVEESRIKIDPIFKRLISDLQKTGIETYVISNGYTEIVSPLATELGIPSSHIAANNFIWLREQAIFVAPSALHSSRGKIKIINKWKASGKISGPIIMVGDGQADRNVYLEGLARGFIQANYYSDQKEYDLRGNFLESNSPKDLQEGIFKLIHKISSGGL